MGSKSTRLAVVGLVAVICAVAAAAAAADVRVSRAELNGTKLRIEGTAAPGRAITVDGVVMGTSDASGAFRIERDPFAKPADCVVDVNDGSAVPAAVTLSGCTVSTSPPAAASASLSALRVEPIDILAGSSATGTVTLTAAAPAGGIAVTLSSDNAVAATVPPSVTVPAGATSAAFAVTTNNVANSQSAIIIGSAGGATAHDVITVWTAFAYANG